MGENSKIEWTDHTFNPWIGCTKVSPACKLCYAETLMDKRYGRVKWGAGQPRVRTSPANWRKPLAWNREAERARRFWAQCGAVGSPPPRPRVFCASLADWLDDDQVPIEWLADLLALVDATQDLGWLLLTKRPHLWRARIEAALERALPGEEGLATRIGSWLDGEPPANVWLGCTVEDQERADERIPALLAIPARVRFLSCEPLLGPLNLTRAGALMAHRGHQLIHWIIGGGESGRSARPTHPDWARGLRDDAIEFGVAFHWKQWGEWLPASDVDIDELARLRTSDPRYYALPDGGGMVRVGRDRAGRLLDGRTWDEVPRG